MPSRNARDNKISRTHSPFNSSPRSMPSPEPVTENLLVDLDMQEQSSRVFNVESGITGPFDGFAESSGHIRSNMSSSPYSATIDVGDVYDSDLNQPPLSALSLILEDPTASLDAALPIPAPRNQTPLPEEHINNNLFSYTSYDDNKESAASPPVSTSSPIASPSPQAATQPQVRALPTHLSPLQSPPRSRSGSTRGNPSAQPPARAEPASLLPRASTVSPTVPVPTTPNSTPTTVGTPVPVSAPTLASVSTSTSTPSAKRFPALPPFVRPTERAPVAAVVDLGTAERAGGLGVEGVEMEGEKERERGRGREQERVGKGKEGRVGMSVGTKEKEQYNYGKKQVVMWSRWDRGSFPGSSTPSTLLFITYSNPSTLAIWDTTRLDVVEDVLRAGVSAFVPAVEGLDGGSKRGQKGMEKNRDSRSGSTIVHAGVLPGGGGGGRGRGREEGVVIGVLISPDPDIEGAGGTFTVYSLQTQRVLKYIDINSFGAGTGRADRFEASTVFIVISTVMPPRLHILSAESFVLLHTIKESQLTPYIPPPHHYPSPPSLTSHSITSGGPFSTSVAQGGSKGISMLSNAFAGIAAYSQGQTNHLTGGKHTARRPVSYAGPPSRGYGYGYGYGREYDEDEGRRDGDAYNRDDPDDTVVDNGARTRHHHHRQSILNGDRQRQGRLGGKGEYECEDGVSPRRGDWPRLPRAVYALEHRLLAFACSGPNSSSARVHGSAAECGPESVSTSSPARSSVKGVIGRIGGGGSGGKGWMGLGMGTGIGGMPGTQAELGSAALKVGGSVWSGMRTLGGLAVSAAQSRVSGAGAGEGGGRGEGRGVGRFYSRSAPEGGGASAGTGWRRDGIDEDEERERERRYSGTSESATSVQGSSEGDHFVTIVDLSSLRRSSSSSTPERVAEFMIGKDKQAAKLGFSTDGCAVLVVPRDGQVVQIFQIRPSPLSRCGGHVGDRNGQARSGKRLSDGPQPLVMGVPWHLYNLRRGRTSAVVESIDWAGDGRWVAIGTRKRTVHVFPVNPYGGRADHRSHMEGRVRNADELQPMPMDLSPIMRLRGINVAAPEQSRAPISFIFIKSSDSTLPAHLLPQLTTPAPLPSTASDASSSPPISPGHPRHHPTNFQDILLFDPTNVTLSLRRIMLEIKPKEQGLAMSASAALGATSISLPGVGAAGRLSGSPSKSAAMGHGRSSSRSRSGLTQTLETPMEMVAKESTVTTWDLRQQWDDIEVRKPLGAEQEEEQPGRRTNWLAQAELSTHSRSSRILPRSIYLSHQFSFRTLGEDYHALIRRYQLDIGGEKIDVRKEVQISAYPTGSGESFVEGFSSPRDMRHRTLSSSFDEPLASALAAGIDHPHTLGILPMFPNGTPGSRPQSFRNPIPIRTIGDGMSESLGRIRREINRVRSPRLRPRPDSSMSSSVPLEFDEEDEDFTIRDTLEIPDSDGRPRSRDTSRGGGSSGPSVSTPATSDHPLDEVDNSTKASDDAWDGWSSEDKLAIEEAERFDNIDVLGLLDEEQTASHLGVVQEGGRTRRQDM